MLDLVHNGYKIPSQNGLNHYIKNKIVYEAPLTRSPEKSRSSIIKSRSNSKGTNSVNSDTRNTEERGYSAIMKLKRLHSKSNSSRRKNA